MNLNLRFYFCYFQQYYVKNIEISHFFMVKKNDLKKIKIKKTAE